MKKSIATFYFMLLCLLLSAQDKIAIGKMDNDKPVLTANADSLCEALSKNLAIMSNIKERYTSVQLLKTGDEYRLVFRGSNYKTTFRAYLAGEIMYVAPKTSCTTSDKNCGKDPDGCVPSGGLGQCACSGCPNDASCTKTCSSSSLLE